MFRWFRSIFQSKKQGFHEKSISLKNRGQRLLTEADRQLSAASSAVDTRNESALRTRLADCEKALGDLRLLIKEHEALERSLRESIKTYEELTIPGLVASHQMLISRWEAEALVQSISIHAQKKSEA